jgi:hypothetical protein
MIVKLTDIFGCVDMWIVLETLLTSSTKNHVK